MAASFHLVKIFLLTSLLQFYEPGYKQIDPKYQF